MSENPALNLRTVKLIEVLRKGGRRWCVEVHYRDEAKPDSYIWNCYRLKSSAKKAAISMAIFQAHQQGFPIQVHVKKRNGRLPKGGHDVMTYGRDPRDSKG
jgi:hypothetical protein